MVNSQVRGRFSAPLAQSAEHSHGKAGVVGSSPTAATRGSEQEQERKADVPKNEKRVKVTLACDVCKRRNYITMKNRQNDRERIEMKKYCRWDRRHTLHKETR